MSSAQSRHIPTSVVQQLRADARDRCCICGHFLDLEDIPHNIEGRLLDRHHIIYFSEGGENTEDNLVLVDPYCHRRIHRNPEKYSVERLREAKRHWIRMRDLLPERTSYLSEEGGHRVDGELCTLPFHVAALNLNYLIDVPETVTVAHLASFIAPWIMHPLVVYARLAPFPLMFGQIQLTRLRLTLKSDPSLPLDPTLSVGTLCFEHGDALVALIDIERVAAMVRERKQEEEGGDTDTVARITLTWGKRPRDLDLYLSPTHQATRSNSVFFGNKGALRRPPWAALKDDIQNGYGPEVITIMSPAQGPFFIDVDNYSGDFPLRESQVLVVIEVADKRVEFQCRAFGDGRRWRVCKLDIEAGTVERIDEFIDRPPADALLQ